MNISLTCDVSLSKKLRTLIGNNMAQVTLDIGKVIGGIGQGTLTISVDDSISLPDDLLNKETSIMLTPKEIQDEMESLHEPVVSMFSEKDRVQNNGRRTIIDKMASRTPPEKSQVRYAIKTEEELVEEMPYDLIPDKQIKNYVSTLSELLESINRAKSKINDDLDLSGITDPRKRAVAIEQKELSEAIGEEAWVVNEKCGSMSINDINIVLSLNIPFNLNRVSSKKLSMSKELQRYLQDGTLRLISPDEVKAYKEKLLKPIQSGLEVYDSSEDAAESAFRPSRSTSLYDNDETEDVSDTRQVRQIRKQNQQNQQRVASSSNKILSLDELDSPTEEESNIMITSVGTGLPNNSGMTLSGGVRKTTHSAGVNRSVPRMSERNSDEIKTIARIG